MSEQGSRNEHSNEAGDRRPRTTAEKEAFSSGGKRNRIFLRGKWGFAVDRVVLRPRPVPAA